MGDTGGGPPTWMKQGGSAQQTLVRPQPSLGLHQASKMGGSAALDKSAVVAGKHTVLSQPVGAFRPLVDNPVAEKAIKVAAEVAKKKFSSGDKFEKI